MCYNPSLDNVLLRIFVDFREYITQLYLNFFNVIEEFEQLFTVRLFKNSI